MGSRFPALARAAAVVAEAEAEVEAAAVVVAAGFVQSAAAAELERTS